MTDCENPNCIDVEVTQRMIEKFVKNGLWGIVGVGGSPDEPTFSYTVGLHHHNLPDLIIIGLNPLIAKDLLNPCAQMMIGQQSAFSNGSKIDDLANLPLMIVDVDMVRKKEYVFQAYNHYRTWSFELQQLVMSDVNGRFPWEDGFEERMRWCQPVLGNPSFKLLQFGKGANDED